MSTDRELLEWAAKAAGIQIDKSETNGGGRGNTGFDLMGNAKLDCHNGVTWNPLTDDGDALRLAAKVRINIDFDDQCAWRRNRADNTLIQEFWGGDYPPCYRHAIVRATAEIGKSAGSGALGDGGKT